MRNILSLFVTATAAFTVCCSDDEVAAAKADPYQDSNPGYCDYMPLEIGNKWVYRCAGDYQGVPLPPEDTWTVTGRRTVGGKNGYVIRRSALMEVDYLAREGDLCFVYILDGGGEGRWALCVADVLTGEPVYDFFQGNRIYYEGVSTKKVAAGTFANCKSFYYLYVSEGVTSWLTECFAPRVGLIYAEYGDDLGPEFWTYELKSYEVKYSSSH